MNPGLYRPQRLFVRQNQGFGFAPFGWHGRRGGARRINNRVAAVSYDLNPGSYAFKVARKTNNKTIKGNLVDSLTW